MATEENTEQVAAAQTDSLTKTTWRDVVERFSYNGIVRNIPFLLFLSVLCVLYIANSSRAVSLTRELTEKGKQLKELRWQYLDIQSRLMLATSESQLTRRAADIGIKPLDKPAFEIRITKPKKEKN